MKRSIQEIIELVVFALIAVLIGTGVLWLVGWLIGLVGMLFMWVAGLLWWLLIRVIPVVVIIAAVYALFRLLQRRSQERANGGGSGGSSSGSSHQPVVSGPRSSGSPSADPMAARGVGAPLPPVSVSPSESAGRPAPAAAPITTPPVAVSGEPVSPLAAAPVVSPSEPVAASGEPVPPTVIASEPVDSSASVTESAEPIEVVEAEPVNPDDSGENGKRKK